MSNLDSETKERLGGDVSVPARFIENLIDLLTEDTEGYQGLISELQSFLDAERDRRKATMELGGYLYE